MFKIMGMVASSHNPTVGRLREVDPQGSVVSQARLLVSFRSVRSSIFLGFEVEGA